MSITPYSRILNFALYQFLWFTAILGGATALPVLILILLLHLSLTPRRTAELALMLGAAFLGMVFDGLLATVGFYTFAEAPRVLPIPLWLVGVWMGFAATLRFSMAFMAGRPRLMTAAAAVFAPVTYLGAERLGAVEFAFGVAPTAVVIALSWWALTPMLLRLETLTRNLRMPGSSSPVLANQPEA